MEATTPQPTTDQDRYPTHSDDDIRALFVVLFNRQEQQRADLDELKAEIAGAVETVHRLHAQLEDQLAALDARANRRLDSLTCDIAGAIANHA